VEGSGKKFVMPHATILITLVCNLKCRLCSAFSPYYTNSRHPSADSVKKSLERFFDITSYVEKFTICGGEPLTYPYLDDIMRFFVQYTNQIGMLEILTNGTICPSEKLIDTMKQYEKGKFRVLVDNYGENLSVKVKEICTVLAEAGICCDVRNYTNEDPHCGGWVDFGDLTMQKHSSQAERELKYSKCAYPQKLGFSFAIGPDGCMFPCGPARRCQKLGIVDDEKEYINLFDETLSVEEQREKIQAVFDGKSLKACAYCNGLCDDSPRYLPAEQLISKNNEAM